MTQLIGKQLGRYKIQQEIGRGGMARVYRGLDTVLQRPVALKVLAPQLSMDPEFGRRFNREAVIAANLHHPAIVTIYDIDEYNVENQFRLHYIAMEFIQGRSLHAILDDRDALGLGYAVSILEPLGRALDYAHSRGAVHRDVKPHNVLIDADGRVLLADFGIAQPPDADTERLTRTGVFMGTPEYISPEQAEARRVDGRSDLYSLGVVAYEIITGRVPFSGATPQLIIAHSQTPPPRPSRIAPHLPPELDAVLMQALAKDPDERFRNGATLVEALRNVAQHHGAPLASNQQIAALVRPQDSAGQPTISLGKGQTPAASLPIPPQQPAAAPAPAPVPAPRQRPPAQTANSQPVPPPVQPPIPPSQPPAPPAQPAAPPPGTGSAGYPPRSPRQRRFSPNQVAVAVVLALLGLALLALFVRGSNSDTGIDVAPTESLPGIGIETTEPAPPTDVPPPATTDVPSATSAPPTEAPSPVPPSPVPPSPVPPSPVPPSPVPSSPVPPSPVPPTETATPEPPTATLEPPTATPVLPTPILEFPTATAPPEYPPPGTAITNTQPTVAVSTTGTPAGVEATPVPTATAPPQVVATPTATELIPTEPSPTAILQMEPDPTDTDTAEPADLLAGPSATPESLPPEPSPSPLPTATPTAVPATPSLAPTTTEPTDTNLLP